MKSFAEIISGLRHYFRVNIRIIPNIMQSEFKLIISDLASIMLCFGVQILYPIVYPMGFYAGHDVVRDLPIAAVDMDKTSQSALFIRMTDASESVNVTVRPDSLEEAKELFQNGEINGFFVIPKDFEKSILSGVKTTVPVYGDASLFYIYKQALSAVSLAAGYLSAGIQIQRFEATGMSSTQAALMRAPLRQISMPLYNPAGSYSIYLLPGILFLILHQTLFILIGILGGIRRERGLNAEAAALSQSHGENTIVLGRTAMWVLIFMVHFILFYTICFPLYGLPQRASLLFSMIFVLPMFIAVSFFGITLSRFIKTKEMALLFYLWLSIPFLFLSGYSWPSFAMPDYMQAVAAFIPATPGISGLIKMLEYGASFGEVMGHWLHLWLLAFIYLITAIYSLRRLHRDL